MTVSELIEKLTSMPGHIDVFIESPCDGSGGGAETDYLYTLDCELSSFPTRGRIAVILMNKAPT
jgi:hypothetical protein